MHLQQSFLEMGYLDDVYEFCWLETWMGRGLRGRDEWMKDEGMNAYPFSRSLPVGSRTFVRIFVSSSTHLFLLLCAT